MSGGLRLIPLGSRASRVPALEAGNDARFDSDVLPAKQAGTFVRTLGFGIPIAI